ncbi:MAG: 6-phosphogluconolactonase [Alphaproteobacteria bacterium]|nr:6-phosphogluconolactonase [Alphaproteobacteria bacterium]MBU1514141.1 6-phosphogluconolactonase [Alphaproteobacteria bacterium]MBU2096210.1 6-phosphogluconolactonase [Alphaproteobacteria bacterium]MBU2151164.1 6-phosphogluconolactonase [Alphaproteobacteria bacterium]MBU2307177.1 6-phosphogluconolactonase [Alphaproteobacteria bacterium]
MIETFPNGDALADAAAHAIADRLAEALRSQGRASLVATGGRSPAPIYDRLSAVTAFDWTRVVVTLSDERCVAADDPSSNARLVRDRLLTGAAAKAHLLPLWPEPEAGALAALAPFDAVMLGMGEDGHIASLIPGDPGLEAAMTTADLTRPVPAGLGKPPVARITLTLSALLNARAIFLLIAGEAKRGVIQRALAGEDLPVGRLISQSKAPIRILWTPDGG